MAGSIEAALPERSMAFESAHATNADISAFLSRHAIRKLAPLYPEMVNIKKRRQLSSRQLTGELQRRFAARASRFRGSFQPPDIARTYVLEIDRASDVPATLAALRGDPDVEYAEEDKWVSINVAPNDPYLKSAGTWGQSYDDLWGVKKIGAPAVWTNTPGAGIVVAVVDTGIDYNHPDIRANVWINQKEVPGNRIDDDGDGYVDDVQGWNFDAETNSVLDDNGHGTHVAGTIAASGNNGIGVIGVAWQAKVMAVKGLDSNGDGRDSALARAIIYAAGHGADVINDSWGGVGDSKTIADAVSYAHQLGAVIVAAAGNDSADARDYHPGGLWNVITVAATDSDDRMAEFSNWGSRVDVAAPGVDILSLRASGTSLGSPLNANYTRANGTSMAAPHVSGAAALILAQHPEYSNEDVRQAMRVSSDELALDPYDPVHQYGRMNAAAAFTVQDVLEAKISAPFDGITGRGDITITGVARGAHFAYYNLEYGAGESPASWTMMQTSTLQSSGTLGRFDATAVPNGRYTIRLTVYNRAGQAFTDSIRLTAAAAAIVSPALPNGDASAMMYMPGLTIPITGTAVANGFQRYEIDWTTGRYGEGDWQTGGIVLTNGGSSSIVDGVLAKWQTPRLAKAGYYIIRLRVVAASFTNDTTTTVYLEPDLLSAEWPKWFTPGPYWGSGVVPAANADGGTRLLLASPGSSTYVTPRHPPVEGEPGALWTIPLNGSPLKMPMPAGYSSLFQPAVSNFDGLPGDEAVVADLKTLSIVWEGGALHTFGSYADVRFDRTQVVIEDLNGDSRPEIIAYGSDSATKLGYVFAWRGDGTRLNAAFPIQISDRSNLNGQSANRSLLIVADIDGDKSKEIVIPEALSDSTYTLRVFTAKGAARTWKVPVISGVTYAMIAADLDRDGKLEIVLVSYLDDKLMLHVFEPDGSERAGFPLTLPNPMWYGESFLAAGDLDRDGREEIVLAHDDWLYAFQDDGKLLSDAWPVVAGVRGFGPIVLGDVDGDAKPEVITTRTDMVACPLYPQVCADQKLIAFRADGSVSRSWQLTGMGHELFLYPAPYIADFDHDGAAEIAVAYGVSDYQGAPVSGVVTILRTGAPFNPPANDWPMVHQNSRNTAVLTREPGFGSGSSCATAISPGGQFFAAAGGPGTLQVTAPAGCSWTVSNPLNWLTVSGSASGRGNGAITYQVAMNSGAQRSGYLSVAGRFLLVRQEPAVLPGIAFAGALAQIATAGGWETALTLVNTGSAPGEARLRFFDGNGAASLLPFQSPQKPAIGTVLGSSWYQTLNAHATFTLDATSSGSQPLEGFAELDAGSTVRAFAIYKYTPSGQEAVVPLETREAPSYWLAFDNTGKIGTGVAVTNLSEQTANITVAVLDYLGTQLASRPIRLAAHGHTSFMLKDQFAVVAGRRGVMRFDTPPGGKIAVLGLRANGAAVTTIPVFANVAPVEGSMAQVASGGGWQTTFTLVNTGSSTAQATLKFFGDSGAALQLPLAFLQSGSTAKTATLTQTIAPGASLIVQTQEVAGAPSIVGSAQLTTTGKISGFAVFRSTRSGQEAVVPLTSDASRAYVQPFDNTQGLATGLAIANRSEAPTDLQVELHDESGELIALTGLSLPARGHKSFMLTDLFIAAANRRGTVTFSAIAGGRISALGLRATKSGAVTTIPAFASSE